MGALEPQRQVRNRSSGGSGGSGYSIKKESDFYYEKFKQTN
jgi:hypothetical protein